MNYADTNRWLPKPEPHLPPYHDPDIVLAIRAWSTGMANQEQQLIAWNYFLYATKAGQQFQDLSYRPGEKGTLATAFAEGSKFVGLMFLKLLRPEFTPKHRTPRGAPAEVIQPATLPRMTRSQRQKRQQKRTDR